MLEVRGLEVSVGRTPVLRGVSLELPAGESLALLGANGAGKSTLLRTLSGLHRPRAGRICLEGRDITRWSPRGRVAAGLVQVSGSRALWEELSVADTLAAAGFTLQRRVSRQRTDAVLDVFPGLREHLAQRAGSLSGGEQQLLSLAKALVLQPRLLLVDELTLGLAPATVTEVVHTLREVGERGTTLLVVEQSAAVASRLAQRAVVLDKGEVVFDGALTERLAR